MAVRSIRFLMLLLAAAYLPPGMANERDSGVSAPMTRIDPAAYSCEDYLPQQQTAKKSRRKPAPVQIVQMDEWGMMELEHCDRIQRLAALTATGAQPEFYVQRIPKDRLPDGFRNSIPVLRVVFPERVFFDTAQASMRPEGLDIARIVATSLQKEMPDVTLFVAGHTDSRGGRDYNQNLSVDRANSLAAEILRQGVNVAAVWRIGFGEDMPLVPEIDDIAMGQNRRVEFLFAGKPEAIATWLADMQLANLCSGASREETNGCKRSLELRSSYKAEELVVAREPGANIAPQKVSRTVNPSKAGKALASPDIETYGVDPQRSRKFVINPINRTIALTSPSLGAKP